MKSSLDKRSVLVPHTPPSCTAPSRAPDAALRTTLNEVVCLRPASTPQQPSNKTLAKYGLSAFEWQAILEGQGGVCAVCKKVPNGRLCIDHDHVKGWKKLPPEKRKLHVRGLLCWFCNHAYVGRAITAEKSRNVTAYLEAHVERVLQHALRSVE